MNLPLLGALGAIALVSVIVGSWARYATRFGRARRLVSEGKATLLDVDLLPEYRKSHIEGAVHIPLDELEARLGELGGTDKLVVVYGRGGMRAARASHILRAHGYRVIDLGHVHAF